VQVGSVWASATVRPGNVKKECKLEVKKECKLEVLEMPGIRLGTW